MASLLMNLIRSPVPFHQVRKREGCKVTTNLFGNLFIECVDLDTELSLNSNLQRSEPPKPWLRIITYPLTAVVSARSPPHEVRSIQDCGERTGVLLGSNGEADHHQIDCLRCCGSHDDRKFDRLDLLKERQQCKGIYKSSSC
jgi:hypothetical protein